MAELTAFIHVVRTGDRPIVDAEDGRWAVVLARRPPDLGRASAAPSSSCRHEPPARVPADAPTSLAGGSIVAAAQPVPPRPGPPRLAVGRRARHGRDRRRRRRRQDGPAARGASSPRTAGRSIAVDIDPRVVDVDQRRAVARRRGARPGGPRRATRTRLAGSARPSTAPRRPPRPTSSSSSSRSCSTTSRGPTTAGWTRRSRRSPRACTPDRPSSSRPRCPSATPAAGTRHASRRSPGSARPARIRTTSFVAFSPERLYSGAALRNLATYPKLVGGLGPAVDRPRGGVLRERAGRRGRRDDARPRPPSSPSSPTRPIAT